jgi:hypothetical protein
VSQQNLEIQQHILGNGNPSETQNGQVNSQIPYEYETYCQIFQKTDTKIFANKKTINYTELLIQFFRKKDFLTALYILYHLNTHECSLVPGVPALSSAISTYNSQPYEGLSYKE